MSKKSGKQRGDLAKAARAMLAVIASDRSPAHLLPSSDALKRVREKLTAMAEEIDAWEKVSLSIDG